MLWHGKLHKAQKLRNCTSLRAGTREVGENVAIKADDFNAIKQFVVENKIDMVVVGPEDPLVKGVYDFFRDDEALKSIPVIGPSKAGAVLEGSKEFAKGFMQRHNIPTAGYKNSRSSIRA